MVSDKYNIGPTENLKIIVTVEMHDHIALKKLLVQPTLPQMVQYRFNRVDFNIIQISSKHKYEYLSPAIF